MYWWGEGGGGGGGGVRAGGFGEAKVSCSFCHSIDPDYDQMCKQMVIFSTHQLCDPDMKQALINGTNGNNQEKW